MIFFFFFSYVFFICSLVNIVFSLLRVKFYGQQVRNYCYILNLLCHNTGQTEFFLKMYILWKNQKERKTTLSFTNWLPIATMASPGPGQSQEAGASFGFPSWMQRPKHLNALLMLFPSPLTELDLKWGIQDNNYCSYGMLVSQWVDLHIKLPHHLPHSVFYNIRF